MLTLAVRDETTAGETLAKMELQLEAETVTAAELIRARVHQEVRAHNASATQSPFRGLVRPIWDQLTRPTQTTAQLVDADAQTAVALRAFERGRVLLLVDDKQVTELNETVTLTSASSVSFLKLVPLVGG